MGISSPIPIKSRLRWPHYLAFAMLLVGLFHLTSVHRRTFLVWYSIASGLGYALCRPRESGQMHWEYLKDPGNVAMIVLVLLGGVVYAYFLITGHF